MSLTILSAKYANQEGTAAVVQTVEAGAVLVSQVDTPALWAQMSAGAVAAYVSGQPPLALKVSDLLAAGAGEMSVKQFGAKGDGVTDDTEAIQLACNTAGSSGFGLLFPVGTYLCGAIILASGLTARGCGSRSVVKLKSATNNNLWAAFTASGISISGIKFDGNKANNTAGTCLIFSAGCTRISVDSCEFVNGNCAILVEGAGSSNVLITNNLMAGNTAAISLSQATFCRVANNCLAGNGSSVANSYQINLASCSHSTVTGNTVYGIGDASGDAGVRVSNASAYVTATGNTVVNCSRGLMVVNSSAGSPVEICLNGNVVRDSQFEGCLISQNDATPIVRVSVKGNHISGSGLAGAGYDMVRVNGPSSQVCIIGNIGTASTGWGVRSTANAFGSPDRLVVVGNSVGANPLGSYSIVATPQVAANNL